MIKLRRSKERGHVEHGWLESYHTFSFGDYHDPQWMAFRSLRVINEDFIAAGQGFGEHPHRDMEIITYVVEGVLKHHDSMGHEGLIEAGEVQKMTAGSGITHSEYNASAKDPVHLLQIWIVPNAKNLPPVYQQHELPAGQEDCLLPLPIDIHQDAKVFRGRFGVGRNLDYAIASGRGIWLQMIQGQITLDNQTLNAGDGAAVENQGSIRIQANHQSEFLFFDLK